MASVLVSINVDLIPPESLSELLGVYHAVISRLPLLVDAAADDDGARFRSSRVSAQLGSAALACALAAGEIELGLELLEQARAVFWAQAITAQNLGLDNLPEQLRTQITELLSLLDPREVMSTYWLARAVDERPSHLILQVEKTNLQQLRELLDDVRTVPGFERFMLRPSSAMLMQCATSHPVVVLSADHNSCHALLLLPGDTEPIPVPLEEVNVGDLERMAVETHGVGWRSRVAANEQERVFNVSHRRKSDGNSSVLAELWRLVVKPIVDAMGLTVSCAGVCLSLLTLYGRDNPAVPARVCIGSRPAPSRFCRCMLPASIRAPRTSTIVAATTLCHRMLRRYLRFCAHGSNFLRRPHGHP
jgi:hypothetical protein